ncbi:MAG: ATP-binding cassette domain-containing protein [Bacilli bacterium]
MLELKGVNKTNETGLKNINIKFNKTGLVFIVGSSNEGKEELFNILGGLKFPNEGEEIINGKSTKDFKKYDLDSYRNTYLGLLFIDFKLLKNKTIAKNINIVLDLQEKKIGKKELKKVLNAVGLKDYKLNTKVNNLNNEESQRLCIARAMIKNPTIIIGYEPMGKLNCMETKRVYELLKKISKKKLVIIITEDMDNAKKFGDRILILKDGKISKDTKEEIINPVEEKMKLTKAKLPLKESLNFAISNILKKPLNLTLVLIFLIIGLTSLGLSFTKNKLNIKNLKTNSILVKTNKYTFKKDYLSNELKYPFKESDIVKISKEVKNNFSRVYEFKEKVTLNFPYAYNKDILYYIDEIKLSFVEKNDELNIIGDLPKTKNEIVINSFIADQIIKNGIKVLDSTSIYTPNNYEEIIKDKKEILLNNLGYFKIVGIELLDTVEFEPLKKTMSKDKYPLNYKNLNYLIKNDYKIIYVDKSFFQIKRENIFHKASTLTFKEKNILTYNKGYLDDETLVYTIDGLKKLSDISKDAIVLSYDFISILSNQKFETDKENNIKKFLKDNNVIKSNVDEKTVFKIAGILKNENIKSTALYNKELIENSLKPLFFVNSLYGDFSNFPLIGSNFVVKNKYSDDLIKLKIIDEIHYICKYIFIFSILIGTIFYIISLNNSKKRLHSETEILNILGCKKKSLKTIFIIESLIMLLITNLISFHLITIIVNKVNNLCLNGIEGYLSIENASFLTIGITSILLYFIGYFLSINKIKS